MEWYIHVFMLHWGEEEAYRIFLDLGADINGHVDDLTPLLAATAADPSFKLMKLLVGNPNL